MRTELNADELFHESSLQCITLVEAANFPAISRGALYALLASGQLASIHIGRACRIPMVELHRFVCARLAA